MYQIKTYNAIAKEGLAEFGDNYRINQSRCLPNQIS